MREIIKEVISSGVYNLSDLLRKINTLWLQASLTDLERDELIQLAQENANPEYGNKPIQDQLNTILERVASLENSISALRTAIESIGGEVQEPGETEEWPEWYP